MLFRNVYVSSALLSIVPGDCGFATCGQKLMGSAMSGKSSIDLSLVAQHFVALLLTFAWSSYCLSDGFVTHMEHILFLAPINDLRFELFFKTFCFSAAFLIGCLLPLLFVANAEYVGHL